MNATVIEVARNAGQAAETAGSAREKAQDGAGTVGKVVTGMNDVQKQTNQLKSDMALLGKQAEDIGRIMTVITDIADQTNLWRSMPPSRPPARATPGAASPLWPTKCASWPKRP